MKPQTIIRIPADAARIVLYHEEFRWLGCAARLRGDWVERRSYQSELRLTYEAGCLKKAS
jgi:hypothetical protein